MKVLRENMCFIVIQNLKKKMQQEIEVGNYFIHLTSFKLG